MVDETTVAAAADMIPKARLDEVLREVRGLKAQATELAATVKLKDQELSARDASLGEIRGELAKRDRVSVLFRAGIRDEGGEVDEGLLDYLGHRYETQPVVEGKERSEFGPWLEEFRGTDPVVLRPFKAAGTVAPVRAGVKPQPAELREPRTQGPPAAPVGYTAEQIARMDRATYKAAREAITQQLATHGIPR